MIAIFAVSILLGTLYDTLAVQYEIDVIGVLSLTHYLLSCFCWGGGGGREVLVGGDLESKVAVGYPLRKVTTSAARSSFLNSTSVKILEKIDS